MGSLLHNDRSSLDQGYAWIVTAAVFLSNLLVVGYFRSFSIFFADIVDTFDTTYTFASVIMGVQGAVCCVTALLVFNVLLDKVGARPVAVCGGLVFSAGIFLAYFAESALFLVFTLGVLVGIGNGAAYGPGTVLLSQYFEKRRALATSLACVGSSVGSMVLPILTTELILLYGLQGAFLIFGGLMLNLCVTSALYRPLPAVADSSDASSDCESSLLSDKTSTTWGQHASDSASLSADSGLSNETPLTRCCDTLEKTAAQKSQLFIPAFKQEDVFSCSNVNSLMNKLIPDLYDERKGFLQDSNAETSRDDCYTNTSSKRWLLPVLQKEKPKEYASAQDLVNNSQFTHHVHNRHGTLTDLTSLADLDPSCRLSQVLHTVEFASMFSSQPHLPTVSPLLTEVEQIIAGDDGTKETAFSDDTVNDDTAPSGSWQTLCSWLSCDGQLMRNPWFWLIQVYAAGGFLGSQAAFVFLPSLLQGKGVDKEMVALALAIWGACSLVGRLLCGVIADRQILRPTTLTALGFVVLGLLFFLVPVMPDDLEVWLAFCVVYGVLEGLYFCLMPVIVIDLLSLQHFSSAFGFTRLSQSVAVMLLFPVMGHLRDVTGNYDATFCFIGGCAVLSAGLFICSSAFRAVRHSKHHTEQLTSDH